MSPKEYARSLEMKVRQLQAELDKYRWIPVSERLPEHNQEVTVFAVNAYCYCRRFKTKDGFGSNGMEGFHNVGGTKIMPTKNITHWMPLPDQPEGSKE